MMTPNDQAHPTAVGGEGRAQKELSNMSKTWNVKGAAAVAGAAPCSEKLETALVSAINALECYADPESYHAIMILPDRPAGWFADDIGIHQHPDYNRKMPGVRARRALEKIRKLISSNDSDQRPGQQ